jgi:two-component system cell cycle response regulator
MKLESEPRRDREKLTILIADDSPVYRKLLQETLASQNYTVLVAKDGREALAIVEEHRPTVLITDWEMPDITGIELCAQIRKDQEAHTHVILLTSNTEKEQIVKGLAAGADDYLTKPFHEGELLARVGVGVRIAELHREIRTKNRLLEELALTDSLTGLPNRRSLEDWAERALHAALRHGFLFWVAIADLDHFKSINDRYGHEAGDLVLRRFGELLKAHTRGADMCARLGGEEFVLVLGHVDKHGAEIAINRLRAQVEAEIFRLENAAVRVTGSFGVAGVHEGAKNFRELLRDADAALYVAKERGRNRVEFSPSSQTADMPTSD